MKWEVKKLKNGKFGIYLMQKYCKTDEPVCYGASITMQGAQNAVDSLNKEHSVEKVPKETQTSK